MAVHKRDFVLQSRSNLYDELSTDRLYIILISYLINND